MVANGSGEVAAFDGVSRRHDNLDGGGADSDIDDHGIQETPGVALAFSLKLGGSFQYLEPPSLAYVTVYLGLTNPRRAWLLRSADYSNGLFLYHWVIMRTVMTVAPRHDLVTLFVGLPLAFCVAVLSGHFVERPSLELWQPRTSGGRSECAGSLASRAVRPP
jgi:peptidoglycan/LPS O-acetylase OafA/YrhL